MTIPGVNTNPQDLSGHNVIGIADEGNATFPGSLTGTLAAPLDPLLGDFALHGGKTNNWSINYTSPAYNRSANPLGLDFDQRGRDRVRGLHTDVGSYESLAAAVDFTNLVMINGENYLTSFLDQQSMITSLYGYAEDLEPGLEFHVFRLPDAIGGTPGELPILAVQDSGTYFYAPFGGSAYRWTITFETSWSTYSTGGIVNALTDGIYDAYATLPALTPAGVEQVSPDFLFVRLFGNVLDSFQFTDNVDFVQFRAAIGAALGGTGNYDPAFDFNGDGYIDNVDFIEFRQRLGLDLYP